MTYDCFTYTETCEELTADCRRIAARASVRFLTTLSGVPAEERPLEGLLSPEERARIKDSVARLRSSFAVLAEMQIDESLERVLQGLSQKDGALFKGFIAWIDTVESFIQELEKY